MSIVYYDYAANVVTYGDADWGRPLLCSKAWLALERGFVSAGLAQLETVLFMYTAMTSRDPMSADTDENRSGQ